MSGYQGSRPPPSNDLTVTVNGQTFGGWQQARVTRGVERMPSDFALTVTERYPGQPDMVVLQPGQKCVVRAGTDVLLTGRIDRYNPVFGPDGHSVTITGRGNCRELVDCAAGFGPSGPTGGQVGNAVIRDICKALAQPFGITVQDLVSDPGNSVPQFNIIFGETVYEIIDRVARYGARLAYEDPNGNLVLAQVGTGRAASGFVQGQNIQAASGDFTMGERFSVYYATTIGTDTLSDIGDAGFLVGKAIDPGVPDFRPTVIVSSEMQIGGQLIASLRANWEAARRYGRSQAVTLTCDNWRDSAGALWQPNTLAKLTIPAMKLDVSWIISEVSFNKGGGGTTADLTLMPAEAFKPEPSLVAAFDWQVSQALAPGAADPNAT